MFLAEQEVYIFYLAKIISIFNGERKNTMQYIGEKACVIAKWKISGLRIRVEFDSWIQIRPPSKTGFGYDRQ